VAGPHRKLPPRRRTQLPEPLRQVHEPLGQPSPGGSRRGHQPPEARQWTPPGRRRLRLGPSQPGATGRYADLRTRGRERDLEAVPRVGAPPVGRDLVRGTAPGHGQNRGQPATPAGPSARGRGLRHRYGQESPKFAPLISSSDESRWTERLIPRTLADRPRSLSIYGGHPAAGSRV
jgi:hypothetical protein